jgi:hypothetical protein
MSLRAVVPSAATTSTRGEGWPTCSLPSNLLRAGEEWRLASVGGQGSSPSSCAIWPRISTRKPRRYAWVVDNLNIHSAASFYEVFDAERARELCRRIEFCYTPVHGSWLNMAEIEISVLVRQCLGGRRIPEAEILRREAGAWCEERNRLGASVNWRFTTADARTKLRRLYPSIER